MSSPSLELADGSESSVPQPHSRVGIAAFVVSLSAVLVPGHLLALIFIGIHMAHGYVVACNWTSAALAATGIVLAVIALFDQRRNRFLGMVGWWLGIIALSTLAIAIRVAVRRHILKT